MGIAELIPGVSGGTIAFITGIYVELLLTLRGIGPELLRLLLAGRVRELWKRANLGFLAVLGIGMLTSVLLLSSLLGWLLEHREVQLWAFFFGLIVASVLFIARVVRPWSLPRIAAGLAGVGVGVILATIQPLPAPDHWISTLLAAAVAICAWILPGISGSFLLLLLGKYHQLIEAINGFDVAFLSLFALGCVLGILAFARFLTWLIRVRYRGTLAFLCGLMVGSLSKLWPWQETVSSYLDSSGELLPLVTRPVLPSTWEVITGASASVMGAAFWGGVAIALVLLLDVLSRRKGSLGSEPGPD